MVMHMETAAKRYSSASHQPEKMIHSHTRTWMQHRRMGTWFERSSRQSTQ